MVMVMVMGDYVMVMVMDDCVMVVGDCDCVMVMSDCVMSIIPGPTRCRSAGTTDPHGRLGPGLLQLLRCHGWRQGSRLGCGKALGKAQETQGELALMW